MVTTEEFAGIEAGDVFYRGSTRYAVESIQHRIDKGLGYPVYRAHARTSTKKSMVRRGIPTIEKGYVTFLHLDRSQVHKLVKKDKVRGVREYKSRKNYPFIQTYNRTALETWEDKDC